MAGILADAMMGKSDDGYDRYLALQRMGRPLKPEEMAFMKQYEAQMSASPMPQGGGMGRMPQSEAPDLGALLPPGKQTYTEQSVQTNPLRIANETRMPMAPSGGIATPNEDLERLGILDSPMEEMYSGKGQAVGSPMLGSALGALMMKYPQLLKDSPLRRKRRRA